MNSSTWLALLAAGSFSIQVALAESPDEKAIHDVLDAEIDALFNAHFSQAASLLHPQTQHLFRDILSARFDELLRQYSLTQISLVSRACQLIQWTCVCPMRNFSSLLANKCRRGTQILSAIVLSCPFAETIACNWSHDLAGLGQSTR